MRNIYAYTSPGSFYPDYISVNENGDVFDVSVRSPGTRHGESSWISLTKEQMREMAENILSFLDKTA